MKLARSWYERIESELKKPYIEELKGFLLLEKKAGQVIYPPDFLIFHAFAQTPFDRVRVVIIGQDPYHGPGQANGLAFSVPEGVSIPPSLKNIFKERQEDLGIPIPSHGSLIHWAQQGVLLLNIILTVRSGEPQSHRSKGWEQFTDAIIRQLILKEGPPLIFLLWGRVAQSKQREIAGTHHLVFEAAHPSPYSAERFFGCRHFSKTNKALTQRGESPIHW